MSRNIKKVLGLVLSLLLVFTAAPFSVYAAELAGTGTEDDPFVIETAEDFNTLSEKVSAGDSFADKTISLKNDITLTASFVPVGSETAPFSGTFLGNGHSVAAGEINRDYAGLFGYIKNAEINNVSVSGSFVADASYAGAVAAYAENSVIDSCVSLDAGAYADNYAGGIAGYAKLGEIKNCVSMPSVSVGGYAEYTGGIAGYSTALISYCENNAYVYGVKNTGGIAGYSGGGITGCSNLAAVEGTDANCGGIAAFAEAPVSLSKNTGNISGTGKTGGIIGVGYNVAMLKCLNEGDIRATDEFSAGIGAYLTGGSIEKCVFSSSLVSDSGYAGGIFGYSSGTDIKECFSSSEVVSALDKAAAFGAIANGTVSSSYYVDNGKKAFLGGSVTSGAEALSAGQVLAPTSYEGWDFAEVWAVNQLHSSYPMLKELGYHDLKLLETVAPTCTEEGVETYICTVCNETVDKAIPAAGHDFQLMSEKAPTCKEKGYRDYWCPICGEKKTEEVPPAGHKDENKDGVCDVCGEEFDPNDPIVPGDKNIFQTLIDFFAELFKTIVEIVAQIKAGIEGITK